MFVAPFASTWSHPAATVSELEHTMRMVVFVPLVSQLSISQPAAVVISEIALLEPLYSRSSSVHIVSLYQLRLEMFGGYAA